MGFKPHSAEGAEHYLGMGAQEEGPDPLPCHILRHLQSTYCMVTAWGAGQNVCCSNTDNK